MQPSQKLKITVIGNSVALRVRPPKYPPENRNYSHLLESNLQEEIKDKLVLVHNMGLGAATIKTCLMHVDRYVSSLPDYIVLNIGVVDACTREVPLWFYRIANSKRYNALSRIFDFLYRGVIIKFRPWLVQLRLKRSWTSESTFKKLYKEFILNLLKDTNAKIITLPINIADERIERELPGSRKKHHRFNAIIEEISSELGLGFLNLESLKPSEYYPDGVHYSMRGHQLVAEKISEIILDDVKQNL